MTTNKLTLRRNWRASWKEYRARPGVRPALDRRTRRRLWRSDWRERNVPAGTEIQERGR